MPITAAAERRRYLAALSAAQLDPDRTLAGVAELLALGGGCTWDVPAPPPSIADPWLLGQALEVLTSPADRTARGVVFTPPELATELAGLAFQRLTGPRDAPLVIDPAAGGAAFLLAAHHVRPDARLVGLDVDRLSARTCRSALALAGAAAEVRCADALLDDQVSDGTIDVVLSNPPFLSQLASDTARGAGRRAALRHRFGSAAGGYVDDVALFVLRAVRWLRPGGVAVLIVPESVLSTRDAAAVRAEVSAEADVEVVWRDRDRIFPGTPTCALALTRRRRRRTGRRSWADLLADDAPPIDGIATAGVLADVATATADFRDAYYLIADHVAEADVADAGTPIVTVGLIDPGTVRWGLAAARFAKQRWIRPVATDLPATFVQARCRPKVMLATQTRVLEAVADPDGRWLPTTPVVSLFGVDLWRIAAVLTNPVTTAVAVHRHAGAARSRGALKLSARDALALPLPAHDQAWDAAATALRSAEADGRAAIERCGMLMAAAYGIEGEAAQDAWRWWSERLPRR